MSRSAGVAIRWRLPALAAAALALPAGLYTALLLLGAAVPAPAVAVAVAVAVERPADGGDHRRRTPRPPAAARQVWAPAMPHSTPDSASIPSPVRGAPHVAGVAAAAWW
jgi:hypothetical protein